MSATSPPSAARYEADVNRTVAVHADAIVAALQHVDGGTRVLAEIEASRRR